MELEAGIGIFLTREEGIGGRLRATPDDFVVDEIPIELPRSENGAYTVALVRSRSWETNRLVRAMARSLRVSRNRISFAGTKDKRAITTQHFQFDLPPDRLKDLRLKDVEILETFRTDRKLEIGDLWGNRFNVAISEISISAEDVRERMDAISRHVLATGGFPNFFGIQRFGAVRPVTHVVGRNIVRGQFKEAVDAYVANPIEGEDEEAFDARASLEESGDYSEALKTFPDKLSFEKAVLNHLVQKPGDYVGALMRLPHNLQMMFIHSYQSYIFNRILSERMRRGLPINEPLAGDIVLAVDERGLPDRSHAVPVNSDNLDKVRKQCSAGKALVSALIFGSESEFAGGEMGEIERSIIEAEGLRPLDFIIEDLPRLSSKGQRREILAPLRAINCDVKPDRVKMRFKLTRGCYATSLLREFMKADAKNY